MYARCCAGHVFAARIDQGRLEKRYASLQTHSVVQLQMRPRMTTVSRRKSWPKKFMSPLLLSTMWWPLRPWFRPSKILRCRSESESEPSYQWRNALWKPDLAAIVCEMAGAQCVLRSKVSTPSSHRLDSQPLPDQCSQNCWRSEVWSPMQSSLARMPCTCFKFSRRQLASISCKTQRCWRDMPVESPSIPPIFGLWLPCVAAGATPCFSKRSLRRQLTEHPLAKTSPRSRLCQQRRRGSSSGWRRRLCPSARAADIRFECCSSDAGHAAA